jgi:phenylpyruvate tautomerase PptA (4-oxalocrotonate tautomerase family)
LTGGKYRRRDGAVSHERRAAPLSVRSGSVHDTEARVMAQIKIYGLRSRLDPIKSELSDVIHGCVVDALCYPRDKRAHRFFPLDGSDFFYPSGRSDRYTILEISLFAGRSVAAKKALMGLLFERVHTAFGIAAEDLEITIRETPKHDWWFRGLPGDEHQLEYKVEV